MREVRPNDSEYAESIGHLTRLKHSRSTDIDAPQGDAPADSPSLGWIIGASTRQTFGHPRLCLSPALKYACESVTHAGLRFHVSALHPIYFNATPLCAHQGGR